MRTKEEREEQASHLKSCEKNSICRGDRFGTLRNGLKNMAEENRGRQL